MMLNIKKFNTKLGEMTAIASITHLYCLKFSDSIDNNFIKKNYSNLIPLINANINFVGLTQKNFEKRQKSTSRGLTAGSSILWTPRSSRGASTLRKSSSGSSFILDLTEREIHDFLEGKLQKFTVPIALSGTEFQNKVYKALLKIPYGKTKSYQAVAASLNNPKACRAVANANSKNKLVIIVPCHRIIGANGSLAGYSDGIERKKYLLELEQ